MHSAGPARLRAFFLLCTERKQEHGMAEIHGTLVAVDAVSRIRRTPARINTQRPSRGTLAAPFPSPVLSCGAAQVRTLAVINGHVVVACAAIGHPIDRDDVRELPRQRLG